MVILRRCETFWHNGPLESPGMQFLVQWIFDLPYTY